MKKIYIATGIFFLMLAAAVLILRPVPYAKTNLNITFYIFVIGLAYLHITRHRTFQLYVDDSEIYCYNGLLNVKHIPLSIIEKIEYRPNARILIYTNIKNRTYRLLNVITEDDLIEFLACIKRKKKTIQIICLDEPVREKEEVRESE
ncbi:MAG: hypothetical protein Q4C52_09070 [Eubacteriales bacterium]|nr:hypothetical protein [Eubacteriales bacterium]